MDAIEYITIGAQPDDGTGDSAREGGAKINRNAQKFKAAIDNLAGLNLSAGPVTKLAPGANPTASLTGTAPNYTLSLGLPEGAAGAGAANSADILAIPELARLERSLAAAGVPDEASLILDFTRGLQFARGTAVAAGLPTLFAALGGVSSFGRGSVGTYGGSDGLLKTAAINVPRLDVDPVTRLPRGLLLENPSRTNLLTYSEQFNDASWVKTRCSINIDAIAAPDGLVTADKLVEDATASSTHFLNKLATAAAATPHTFAGNFKAAERSTLYLQMWNAGGSYTAIVDLGAGTIVQSAAPSGDWSAGSVAIIPLGNGFYRAGITATNGATANINCTVGLRSGGSDTYTGDGVSGLYAWGLQLEASAAMSSYIASASSTVTRAADNLTLAPGAWANAAEMSILVEFVTRDLSGATVALAEIGDGTYNNRALVYLNANSARGSIVSGGSTSALLAAGTYAAGTVGRLALAAKLDDFAASFGGAAVVTDSSGAMPLGAPTALYVGRQGGGGGGFTGHIRRIIVYPQRLSNAKLQALSSSAWN